MRFAARWRIHSEDASLRGRGGDLSEGRRVRRIAGCVLMAAVLGTAAASCADIESIASDVCGNAVVDPGEDCDLGSRFAGQTACRAPGSEGECRFDCAAAEDGSPTACPTGFGCGADAICRAPS